MLNRTIALCLLLFVSQLASTQPTRTDVNRVLTEINALRKAGCKCGSKNMPPAPSLEWDHDLYRVSRTYAKYMYKNDHFEHVSKNGEDLGDRLDRIGYEWVQIGENLGVGYDDFYQVFRAWIESPSHCAMLMNPDVKYVGMSKYESYWAQSFAARY